jgi:hypothetical protein
VRANPPTEADFLSLKAFGRLQRDAPIEQWAGVSTFHSLTLAAAMTRRFGHGAVLARLALDPANPIRWVETRGDGHYTISGPPAEMLARVVEVVPLDAVVEGEAQ